VHKRTLVLIGLALQKKQHNIAHHLPAPCHTIILFYWELELLYKKYQHHASLQRKKLND